MQFKVERVTTDWPYLEEDYSNPIILTLSVQERPAQTCSSLLTEPLPFLLRQEGELQMSPSGNLGRREGLTWGGGNPSSRELTPPWGGVNPSGREGRDTHAEGGITELQRRGEDLGQAGQMLPLTPRGDSADYPAAPELLPQHNVCVQKGEKDVSIAPSKFNIRAAATKAQLFRLVQPDSFCGRLKTLLPR